MQSTDFIPIVLGLSAISSFQTTQVLAAPIPSGNRTLGGCLPNLSNDSLVACDLDDSNITSSKPKKPEHPPYIRKPPTEEFCHTSADCDYGYKCDDSGMCAWGCDDHADYNHHERHECVKGSVKKSGECVTVKRSAWGDYGWTCREFDRGCFWAYQCCTGACQANKCARHARW